MKIKLLYIIPTLDRCGAEKQLTLLACNLPKNQFDIKVLALTRNGPYSKVLEAAGIPYEIIGKRSKLSPVAYARLKKHIKTFQPDIVHTWLFAANSYGRQAAFAYDTPVVICGERCVDPWKSRWQKWIDKRLERKTDAYIVNSTGIVDFYKQNGIPEEKFYVIPNAVEQVQPYPQNKEELKRELLRELGLSLNPESQIVSNKDSAFHRMNISGANEHRSDQLPFIIGLLARFWPQKRIRDALWIADQLKFAQLNFYLIILGDGPERESLLRYRDDLQLRNRVVMLGERDDVTRFMPCFDLLWNCSAYEGQSNSILEAQSFGIPVIASDIPGNRDLIQSSKTGILIPEFDGDTTRRLTAFSQETLRILSNENKEVRIQLGLNAQKTVQQEFSLSKMIERHATLYKKLLDSKK